METRAIMDTALESSSVTGYLSPMSCPTPRAPCRKSLRSWCWNLRLGRLTLPKEICAKRARDTCRGIASNKVLPHSSTACHMLSSKRFIGQPGEQPSQQRSMTGRSRGKGSRRNKSSSSSTTTRAWCWFILAAAYLCVTALDETDV